MKFDLLGSSLSQTRDEAMKFGLPGAPLRQARDGTIEIEPLERAYGWAKDAMYVLSLFQKPLLSQSRNKGVGQQRSFLTKRSQEAGEFGNLEELESRRIWSRRSEQKSRSKESEQRCRISTATKATYSGNEWALHFKGKILKFLRKIFTTCQRVGSIHNFQLHEDGYSI